jgi:nucleotide sugar dehydrogenase
MLPKVGIIGNGFVGSAITAGFGLHADIKIFDVDPDRKTHSFEEVCNTCNFVFVGVPTPMTSVEGGKIDLSIMDDVFSRINETSQNKDTVFILKSTVVPGTTERYMEMFPDLRIVFNPEFLTERAARLDFINASRVILGGCPEDVDAVEALYRSRFPHVKIIKTDPASAQFIKYMANCFFAVKVSFMNEMKQAADRLGCDWDDVMNGFVSDGRIGNSHLDVPGHDGSLGYGGKCFPKDINAFIGLFEELGIEPDLLRASWKKNLEVRKERDWADIKGAVSE